MKSHPLGMPSLALTLALASALTQAQSLPDAGSVYVSASNLLLSGGNATLDNSTSNAIGTLAASGVSGLTYWDKDALTIGTVSSTHGISASAAVNIGTQTGDMTVTQSVSTTNAGSTALVLNADMGVTVGAGGNIVLTGSPTFLRVRAALASSTPAVSRPLPG